MAQLPKDGGERGGGGRPAKPVLDYRGPVEAAEVPRNLAVAVLRVLGGVMLFSFSVGFAVSVQDTSRVSVPATICGWMVPVTALAFCIWQTWRGKPGYLIGFVIPLGTCGLIVGFCSVIR